MKRSQSISLVLMGALALGPAGCGSEKFDESYTTFTSVDECVTSGLFTEAECKDFLRSAVAETPRFSSKEECEAKFGEGVCETPAPVQEQAAQSGEGTAAVAPHTGSMWMPMMMGFMAGRFMGAGGPMQGGQGLYGRPGAQPGAGGPSGARTFRTATGATVSSDARGRVANPSPALKQSLSHNAKPAMARGMGGARGGFSGGSSFGGGAS